MASAGNQHIVLLRSDGKTAALGSNHDGRCDIPALDGDVTYTQVSATDFHTVLLRSSRKAVAVGCNTDGQCDIPVLDGDVTYTQISAGDPHTQCFFAAMARL